MLARSTTLIAISAHTADRFRQANPLLRDRAVHVCHLAVPDGRSAGEQPREYGSSSPARGAALIVGRMVAEERYKGHDLLLDVWPRVLASVPEGRLLIVGDGDDRARLQTRAVQPGLAASVTFLGRVPHDVLQALYRDCAFFVMPSRHEGFGLVFVEAMRAGKACIGGVGAAEEVIEHGVTGLVVDPDRPETVLDAVVRLFREPETRERMGCAGAARFAAHFTEATFQQRFRALLGLHTETVPCAE